MISVPVVNMSGKEVGTYKFDPAELAPDINKQLLHDVVVMYEANRRVGTVRQKSRGEVAGSTKKIFRQKGTGRARAGTKRTGKRVGGGRTFPRRPKDWGYRLPKKAVKLATRMALLSKFQDNEAVVIDAVSFAQPKTKLVATMLKALGVDRQTCLLTIAEPDANVWRAARNICGLSVSPARELNAYDLLHQKRLVVTKAALDQLRSPAAAAERKTGGEGVTMAEQLKHGLQLEPYQIILRPLITEKGTHQSERYNSYPFEVHPQATKEEIKSAVEHLWNVRVAKVRTQTRKGKPRRHKMAIGYTSDWKKAIVQLHEEDRIAFF